MLTQVGFLLLVIFKNKNILNNTVAAWKDFYVMERELRLESENWF